MKMIVNISKIKTKEDFFRMTNQEFKDCEFRYTEDNELHCKNKNGIIEYSDNNCDNCMENIHLNCTNFNPKKDYCLKFFRDNISELKECQEKTVFNDKDLSRKWSN